MSIITKTGDDGTTGLMYNRRVPKSHPRVEAYGAVDELNSALGLARAAAADAVVTGPLLAMQKDLVAIMGELATLPEDRARYLKDGYAAVTPAATARLELLAKEIEPQCPPLKGWAMPGENRISAALDFARTVARRAERRVCSLLEANQLPNPEILVYLNRLSDLLWLLARWLESRESSKA
jgi:cob(I)alamin adenosyltransferase